MRILSITFKQSKVDNPAFLTWLCNQENKVGKDHERYWLINTNVNFSNPNVDLETTRFVALLHLCVIHNFQILQIIK